MAGFPVNKTGLAGVTTNVSVWPLSSLAPVLMPVPIKRLCDAALCSAFTAVAVSVNSGASSTAGTVILKVCARLVSWPQLSVPPSSFNCTLRLATPLAFAANVKLSVPSALTAGPVANNAALSLLSTNASFWALSLGEPL